MKTIQKLIAFAILLTGAASLAFAGEGVKYWDTLRKESQFEQLKPGDKVAIVCNMCKTVSEKTLTSADEVTALHKDGEMVTCPACKMQAKVLVKGGHSGVPIGSQVTYVNDKGDETMFIAKVADKN